MSKSCWTCKHLNLSFDGGISAPSCALGFFHVYLNPDVECDGGYWEEMK